MTELEQAAIDKRQAQQALLGWSCVNVAGRTPEELNDIAIGQAKAEVEFLRAANKLNEAIKKELTK